MRSCSEHGDNSNVCDSAGCFPSAGSSPWERGEKPVGWDWDALGANKIIALPDPNTVYVLMEDAGYDGKNISCVFSDEAEANSYAEVRNQFAEHGIVYEVEPWPIGRPGCDETEPHYDGPVWEIRWDLQYNADHEVAPMLKHRWHSGRIPPDCGFKYNPTDRGFHLWGMDRDAVIRQAEAEAAKRVSAELERLRIAAEQKANRTRFRIDSEHEFG